MQDKKVTVYVFPTPFAIFHRDKFDVVLMEDETVEQLARRVYPKVKFNHFAIRTKHVKPDAVVKDGDEVIAWSVPEDPATIGYAIIQGGAYVYNAIVAAYPYILGTMQFASFGYSIYSYVQTRKLAKGANNSSYGKEVDDASDRNYGWDFDASNAVMEGSPLPVIYGKRQVIPPIIQQRATITNLSNKEFLEIILGVAQGGAGFADTITFPADEQGDVDILLNHASWKNYISKTQFSDDSSENINRINSGISVLNGVYYENGTLTQYGMAQDLSNLSDGNTSTRARTLADSQKYDSRNSPGKSGTRGSKYTRNFYFVLGNKCKITEVRFFISRAATTFNVYAGDTTDITQYKLIGSFTGNATRNSWKICQCNTAGKFYQYVLITDFRNSADAYFYEIEVYGSINIAEEEGYTGYAEVETRAGTYNQEPMTICNGVWAALSVNKGLNTSWFSFSTSSGASPESLAITIEFPYGLHDISGSSIASKTVEIACEYRGIESNGDAGDWIKFNKDFNSSSIIEITDSITSPKIVQFETDEYSLTGYDHYEVRMKFASDPGLSLNVQGACNWTLLEEGYSHKPSYPRTACAAVKMLATESLAGGVPQIKVMAERKYIMAYNSIDGEWQAKPASNPAWAAYDILVRPIFDDSALNDLEDEEGNVTPLFDEDTLTFAVDPTDYLREEAFPHIRVKYSDFEEWAEFCDEEQITMSMYFDGTSSVTDCLQYLCDIGRAGIVNRGNVIGVVVDRSALNMDNLNNPLALFKFDDSNVVADTYSENYSDRSNCPTEVQVTYYDKYREYSRKSVIARNDDTIVNQNTKDVTLYTCDDRDIALRHAEYILNMNLIKKGYAWTGDLDSMPLDMGDLVSIYGNLATITGVTFDEEMRRQFTAVNYSHERFGWKKWNAEIGNEGIGIVTFPFVMDGVSFNDIFDGISFVGRIKAWYPSVQTDSVSPSESWEANKGYLIIASDPAIAEMHKREIDYTDSIHLAQGENFISLSYDILDYESSYAYINGRNMAYDVVFQKRIYRYMGAPLVEDVEPDHVTGKINLYAGEIYVVNVSDPIEGVDFPMFPQS